ncbi:MAG: hypothetical protein ACT4PV_10580 [Planctomycetaceae bacterium]
MSTALFLLSAAVLAHELCLLRLLAIAQWHHSAGLVLSVALLGFGVAGTLLALVPRLKSARTLPWCAALYALLALASVRAAARIDFNVLEVGWDASQWLRLLALQGVFFVPFAVAATGLSAALAATAARPGRAYAATMLGSGAGALLAPWLLDGRPPEEALQAIAALAASAALPAPFPRTRFLGAAAIACVLLVAPPRLPMSPHKALRSLPDARTLATRFTPLGRFDRVASPRLRVAPGLSIEAGRFPERQEAITWDGHLVAALDRGDTAYLDDTLGALPIACVDLELDVVLLGVGPDVARASRVVDASREVAELAEPFVVEPVAPRTFLEEMGGLADLFVIHVQDLHAATETPLLTVEGLRRALSRSLAGVAANVAITTPPRAALKLLLTAEAVTPHLVAARSHDRLCVWMRRIAPSAEELARAREFCGRLGFDVVRPRELMPATPRHQASVALDDPGPDYPYDVRPATDARPYFHKTFRWARLDLLFDPAQRSFVEWPFVALVVGFLQVTAIGVLLVAGPLLVSRAARAPAVPFLSLGAAYMLLEMAFLQRAMLRLGSPVHAAAAVMGGFLIGSGAGSALAERRGYPLRAPIVVAVLLAPIGFFFLPRFVPGVAILSAVVALPMGMPFPAALSRLPAPSVPWALAANGCASVSAAAAAPLLSCTFGIPATATLALLFYLLLLTCIAKPTPA